MFLFVSSSKTANSNLSWQKSECHLPLRVGYWLGGFKERLLRCQVVVTCEYTCIFKFLLSCILKYILLYVCYIQQKWVKKNKLMWKEIKSDTNISKLWKKQELLREILNFCAWIYFFLIEQIFSYLGGWNQPCKMK